MIGHHVTGIFPRPKELIEATRTYTRGRTDESRLERAFENATSEVVAVQVSLDSSYVTDGMLKWQDMLRPFTENLGGVEKGRLARWFNNNTFYRKPTIVGEIRRKKSIVDEVTYLKHLPKNVPWKAILPAPYTFTQLSDNQFYKDEAEFMFKYAQILREEIGNLVKLGFHYVQLSDPALVYAPTSMDVSKDELDHVSEALRAAVEGVPIRTCLHTFFGDFSRILPEALDFPVDHLGIDVYETDFEKLEGYSFEKGVALGLIDSRNSLVENSDELVAFAKRIFESIYRSKMSEATICPNCDLEFLPWGRAVEKMKAMSSVVKRLREDLS